MPRATDAVIVVCGHCGGRGRVTHQRLTQALAALSPREWRTTQDVAGRLGLSGENTANLLRELAFRGYTRRRGAKPYEWKRLPHTEWPSKETTDA